MDYCKKCKNFGCNAAGTERTATDCEDYMSHLPTNADRIRAMTDEELAEFLFQDGDCPPERMYPDSCPDCGRVTLKVCHNCWLDWLKQEAE